MFITKDMWEALSTFLFVDKKLSSDNKGELYLRSRFFLLCNFLDNKPFNRTTFNEFVAFKKKQGCRNSYINNIIKVAKHLHEFLLLSYKYDSGLSDYTYFRRESIIYDIPTPQECKAIAEYRLPYKQIPKIKNYKFKCLYYMLTLTGMRVSEALCLKRVDFMENTIIVRDTKTKEERIIPNNPFLYKLVKILPSKNEFVFDGDCEGHLSKAAVHGDLPRRVQALGLKKKVWPHLFRHQFCVEMLRNNDVTLVSKLMGHADMSSTLVYSHYLISDMQNAVMTHPLLKNTITINNVSERLRILATQLLDPLKYTLNITSNSSSVKIAISKR